MTRHALLLTALAACSPGPGDSADDPCASADAPAECLSPKQDADYYAAQSSAYFDTMDYRVELDDWPPYAETVARWEWPPWLKLTAYTRDNIEATDTLLVLYPSIVDERDCRGFDTHPFGRCRVTFYYDDHGGQPCPIYEEFTFNDQGEITWIEAWSDLDGLRPMDPDADPWADAIGDARLSARIPGLGSAEGRIDLDSDAMARAAAADPDVADFVTRASDWTATWTQEYRETDIDQMWATGCGW